MSNYRNQQKGGGLFSALEHQQEISGQEVGILKLRDLIDWESFRCVLEEVTGYAKKNWSKGGQPPFDPVFMFKVMVLQKYHGLSDDATEHQIKDLSTAFKSRPGKNYARRNHFHPINGSQRCP